MRIIQLVLGKANPERMNGVNKVAHQLATTQTNLGYNVSLWGIANTLSVNYPPRVYKTQLFQQYKNPFQLDKNLVQAIKLLSKDTVVHIHGAFIPVFYRIARLLQQQSIPYIYTPHGAFAEGAMIKNKRLKEWYFKLFETKIIENARALQLLGVGEMSHAKQLIADTNHVLIPNGQNMSDLPGFVGVNQIFDHPIFGFCGRLDMYHKGLDIMLKGFRQYLDKGFKGQLELIGDGVDRPKLEALAKKLKLTKEVTFHGKRFGSEKFDRLANVDVFLHTSRMEGFPTAVLEAAGIGKPCLTSYATSVNSYIEEYGAGFTYTENTPENLALQLEKAHAAFQAKELSQIGYYAFEMVQQEFNWETITQKLVRVYQNGVPQYQPS